MTEQFDNLQLQEQELGQLSRDLRMASMLQELALSLPSVNSRQQLLAIGSSSAASLLGAPQAALLLLTAGRDALEAPESFDHRLTPGPGMRAPVGRGLMGSIAEQGEPLLVPDVSSDSRFDPTVDSIGEQPVMSLLGAALMVRDQPAGALVIANRDQPFTSQDLRWLRSLAAMLAAAYENICLIEQLREEQNRLLQAQEELRRKLARDLHDGVTQRIAAAQMEVDHMRRVLRHDPQQLGDEIDRLEHILGKSMRLLRTALFDVRPLVLETEGLEPALRRFIKEHSGDRGAQLRLQIIGQLPAIRAKAGAALFSIIQEAANNAQKHAGAEEISISLIETSEQLVIGVRDSGRGFDPQEVAAGYAMGSSFGMRNMRELVDAIGGSLMIWSEPGKGTSITVTVSWTNLDGHTD